jgi:hypothetical protein
VTLRSSLVTYFQDLDTGELRMIRCTDRPAPLLVQKERNTTPTGHFDPDFPLGRRSTSGFIWPQGVQPNKLTLYLQVILRARRRRLA